MESLRKMQGKTAATLRGLTWKHDRGLAPLMATARQFSERRPEVTIEWETRSLQEFGEASVEVFAAKYDLVVIDHPFMGQVARAACFLPLDEHFTAAQLQEFKQDSVGLSYESYCFQGHLWALPIDAAAQVAGYRPDLLEAAGLKLPQTWEEVFHLAKVRQGFVSAALSPLDSVMCFFTLCANLGEPPFASSERVVSGDIGQQALSRLRALAECSVEGALSANPIAIWEHMASTDEIAYCPLAFGYSNYARKGYRKNLVSFGCIASSGRGPAGATLGGAGLAISQTCKHRDVALEYALWLAGQQCQRTLYVESGGQPASRAAWLDPHANQLANGYFAATLPVLEKAWLRPRFAGFEHLQTLAQTPVRLFMRGERKCHEALKDLDRLYRDVLADKGALL
jgi:multiple sugar transport system substrate-binding protein